jgi:hypothetical protein
MDAYKQAYEHLRYTPCRTLNPVYFAKDGYELQWDGITHLIVVVRVMGCDDVMDVSSSLPLSLSLSLSDNVQ